MSDFFQNKHDSLSIKLKQILQTRWNNIMFMVSYAKETGVSLIQSDLLYQKQQGCTIQVCVTTDQNVTTKKAVEELLSCTTELYVVSSSTPWDSFHVKCFIFQNTEETHVIIGSNNLTKGGLTTNSEAFSYGIYDTDEYEHNIQDIWNYYIRNSNHDSQRIYSPNDIDVAFSTFSKFRKHCDDRMDINPTEIEKLLSQGYLVSIDQNQEWIPSYEVYINNIIAEETNTVVRANIQVKDIYTGHTAIANTIKDFCKKFKDLPTNLLGMSYGISTGIDNNTYWIPKEIWPILIDELKELKLKISREVENLPTINNISINYNIIQSQINSALKTANINHHVDLANAPDRLSQNIKAVIEKKHLFFKELVNRQIEIKPYVILNTPNFDLDHEFSNKWSIICKIICRLMIFQRKYAAPTGYLQKKFYKNYNLHAILQQRNIDEPTFVRYYDIWDEYNQLQQVNYNIIDSEIKEIEKILAEKNYDESTFEDLLKLKK